MLSSIRACRRSSSALFVHVMESDDDHMYDESESSDPEDDQDEEFDICDGGAEGNEPAAKRVIRDDDDFNFDCLTPESIVLTMKKCIDEVNSVFEVSQYVYGVRS